MSLAIRHRLLPVSLTAALVGCLATGTATATATTASDAAARASSGRSAVASAPARTADVDPALAGRTGDVRVIVVTDAAATQAAGAVRALGGTVTEQLPIIAGFAATLPAPAVPTLAAVPGVREITLDGVMHVQADATTPEPDSATAASDSATAASNGTGSDGAASGSSTPATTADASDPTAAAPDPNSLPSVYREVLGADELAARGGDGSGVTVALVDTGVSPSPDLAGRIAPITAGAIGGQAAACVNFSGESTCDDQYGHGTFLAGLIAGNGTSSGGAYRGTAPGAKVLSLKLSGPDGSADVSKVLAAIQWVVSFRQQYEIRVLNLSLGTDSTQSYRVDPLNYAVEQAWKAGIVVAVAASNRGPGSATISKPGDDPYVLTVGAVDDSGTARTDDDVLPDFSSRGPTAADGLSKPDVVAPGAHLVSLAAPGSTISTSFPSTMPAPYRRGSGTSMATAAVSGLVAAMLSVEPTMTPDRVKYALMSTARPAAVADRQAAGAGLVSGSAALSAGPGLANQGLTPSDGRGSLSLSRGQVKVRLPGGNVLDGETTAQMRAWLLELPNWLAGSSWSGSSWSGSSWSGSSWSGSSWSGSSWSSGIWYGSSWSGSSWSGSSWSGSSWSGSSWSGSSWSGSSWSANRWYGSSWSGSQWYGAWDR